MYGCLAPASYLAESHQRVILKANKLPMHAKGLIDFLKHCWKGFLCIPIRIGEIHAERSDFRTEPNRKITHHGF